jgi:hypothetical protein
MDRGRRLFSVHLDRADEDQTLDAVSGCLPRQVAGPVDVDAPVLRRPIGAIVEVMHPCRQVEHSVAPVECGIPIGGSIDLTHDHRAGVRALFARDSRAHGAPDAIPPRQEVLTCDPADEAGRSGDEHASHPRRPFSSWMYDARVCSTISGSANSDSAIRREAAPKQASPLCSTGQQPTDGFRQRGGVLRGDEQTVHTGTDDLSALRNVRRNQGASARRRLQESLGEPFFVVRRENDQVLPRDHLGHVLSMPPPFHQTGTGPVFDLIGGNRRGILRVEHSGQHEADGGKPRAKKSCRIDEHAHSFVPQHAGPEHDDRGAARLRRRLEAGTIDTGSTNQHRLPPADHTPARERIPILRVLEDRAGASPAESRAVGSLREPPQHRVAALLREYIPSPLMALTTPGVPANRTASEP